MPTVVSGMEALQNQRYGKMRSIPPLTSPDPQKDEKETQQSSYDLELSQKARTLQREHVGKQEVLKQKHDARKQQLETEYQQERLRLERSYVQKKRSMGINLYA
ncbi:MAG: hypothetical protein JEZ12_02070 [Desulfobacterium sp.]|nr:hypothetical protein [Desulfobacterium sp.]